MHSGEGIFLSNRAFFCRTGLFSVEPCILLSNRAFFCRTSVIIRFNALSILEWCDRGGKPSRRLTVEDCAFSTCLMHMSDILADSRLYNNDGRPTDFHRYVLASADSSPGYAQPTLTRLYIALRYAWVRFSVLLAYDKLNYKQFPRFHSLPHFNMERVNETVGRSQRFIAHVSASSMAIVQTRRNDERQPAAYARM